MNQQDKTTEQMNQEISRLKKMVQSLVVRVKRLEQDNVRIKYEARLTRSQVLSLGRK